MKKLMERMSQELSAAFEAAGYDGSLAMVVVSNRPDLCEFQCNGAMAGAKLYHKAPLMIAKDVAERLPKDGCFADVAAVAPGFLNFNVSPAFLASYLSEMEEDKDFSVNKEPVPKKIVIDYGGPNVAKPLHVGHLRSAIIGESVKRICRYMGNDVVGDIHLGDWGLQMGLIIAELHSRHPELVYFDESFEGEYPIEPPFTISELEEIYPTASAKSKEDEEFKAQAMMATNQMQSGRRGYMALWRHILAVSVADLKKNYANLGVSFDLWKGESDVQPLIPPMVERLKREGFAYEDQGALVVDVAKESDTKEVPPCMILKSDGASLYTTTDLATLEDRRENLHPDHVIYVVDKRQELHFTQVFRCARKTGIIGDDCELTFLGFGTMNGKDGKPFKTREGGVMRLENLIKDIETQMYQKIAENRSVRDADATDTAKVVGLSAIKYGDLSNQAGKDYVFDVDRFTSFEGNTGPYILYTIVRIKSILAKVGEGNLGRILPAMNESEKGLQIALAGFGQTMESVYQELAPHKLCGYIYGLANAFNHFYHETKVAGEENPERKASLVHELQLTKRVLEECIDLLGFEAPDRM